jgi:hypothetical protein
MKWHLNIKDLIFENGIYKLVVLFIILSFWVVILECKEFVLVKNIDLSFIN